MSAVRSIVLIAGTLLLFSITKADAAKEFERVGVFGSQLRRVIPDARSLAMGEAFTALAEGAAAAWWNPGALGVLDHEWTGAYATREIIPDAEDRMHWLGLSGEYDGVGIGAHLTKFDDAYVGILASGIDLARYVQDAPNGLRLGMGIGLTGYQQDFGGGNVHSWDMDVGALFEWENPIEDAPPFVLRTGYTIRNFWNRKIDFWDTELLLGRRDRAGFAVTALFDGLQSRGAPLKATLSLERAGLLVRAYDGEEAVDSVGGEVTVADAVSARGGYIWDRRAGEEWVTWGVGLGVPLGISPSSDIGVQFDFGSMDWITKDDVHQYSLSLWLVP